MQQLYNHLNQPRAYSVFAGKKPRERKGVIKTSFGAWRVNNMRSPRRKTMLPGQQYQSDQIDVYNFPPGTTKQGVQEWFRRTDGPNIKMVDHMLEQTEIEGKWRIVNIGVENVQTVLDRIQGKKWGNTRILEFRIKPQS